MKPIPPPNTTVSQTTTPEFRQAPPATKKFYATPSPANICKDEVRMNNTNIIRTQL